MSDPLRIAAVAEGPTDVIVIESALKAVLDGKPFVLNQLQPEGSVAFGQRGGGWIGVYRWCKESARRGSGRLRDDRLLRDFDALVVHLDADVASSQYADGNVIPDTNHGSLPCERPCPPASNTTDALRSVLLSWCGEAEAPAGVVLCTPSKSTEAWVVCALFPSDMAARSGDLLECNPNPEARFGQQPKAKRIRKTQSDYRNHASAMLLAWPRVAGQNGLSEARRFHEELLVAL
jgi:hypothetical protein